MPEELYYTVFDTGYGWLGILGSPVGLRRLTLPSRTEHEALGGLGVDLHHAGPSPDRFSNLVARLKAYFSGVRVDFPDTLDLSEYTDFQRDVWRAAGLIPYGETRSYSWIAGQIKRPRAARAVGQALGRNPLPVIVPCHRVLAGDGSIGGFTGGLDMKRFLLDLERTGSA